MGCGYGLLPRKGWEGKELTLRAFCFVIGICFSSVLLGTWQRNAIQPSTREHACEKSLLCQLFIRVTKCLRKSAKEQRFVFVKDARGFSPGQLAPFWVLGEAEHQMKRYLKQSCSRPDRKQRKREQLDRDRAGTRPPLHEYTFKEYSDLLCLARP